MRAPIAVTLLAAAVAAQQQQEQQQQQPAPQQQEPQQPNAAPVTEPRTEPPKHKPFRAGLGVAGGDFDYDQDSSNLDDRGGAGMVRLQFEYVGKKAIGGGIRFENLSTDDDFFADAGFAASRVNNWTAFGHFTWRYSEGAYTMPVRAGLLTNVLTLDEEASFNEVNYLSFGPYVELAPEFHFVQRHNFGWSLYGEFGFGFAGTLVDIEGDPRDYESVSGFAGVEAGTRFDFGPFELGIAYVARWQSMDESDPEFALGGSQVAFGYDAEYQGALVTFAVTF